MCLARRQGQGLFVIVGNFVSRATSRAGVAWFGSFQDLQNYPSVIQSNEHFIEKALKVLSYTVLKRSAKVESSSSLSLPVLHLTFT